MSVTMQERVQGVPEKLWASLSDAEKETCIYFAVADWASGVDANYVEAMGTTQDQLGALVAKGVVDKRTGPEFAQEWLDQHRAEIEALEGRVKDYLHFKPLSPDESRFSSLVRNAQYRAEQTGGDTEPRYRLKQKQFHDYINQEFGDT
jgi:hypothetical protein